MLVLSRKIGEQLFIGEDITVKVLQIRGNRIRLGIDAPEGVRIMRGELTPWRNDIVDAKASCLQM
jgi:carbon storage regulator CsrA